MRTTEYSVFTESQLDFIPQVEEIGQNLPLHALDILSDFHLWDPDFFMHCVGVAYGCRMLSVFIPERGVRDIGERDVLASLHEPAKPGIAGKNLGDGFSICYPSIARGEQVGNGLDDRNALQLGIMNSHTILSALINMQISESLPVSKIYAEKMYDASLTHHEGSNNNNAKTPYSRGLQQYYPITNRRSRTTKPDYRLIISDITSGMTQERNNYRKGVFTADATTNEIGTIIGGKHKFKLMQLISPAITHIAAQLGRHYDSAEVLDRMYFANGVAKEWRSRSKNYQSLPGYIENLWRMEKVKRRWYEQINHGLKKNTYVHARTEVSTSSKPLLN